MARTRKSLAQGLVGAQELPLLDLIDQPHPSWLASDRTYHGHLFPPDASTKLGITYTPCANHTHLDATCAHAQPSACDHIATKPLWYCGAMGEV